MLEKSKLVNLLKSHDGQIRSAKVKLSHAKVLNPLINFLYPIITCKSAKSADKLALSYRGIRQRQPYERRPTEELLNINETPC